MSLFDAEVKTIRLIVERFTAARYIGWPFSSLPRSHVDYVKHNAAMLMQLIQDVAVQRECVAEYPANWIEALKDRFAPAWFLRRWPVQKARIDMTVLYPRVAIPKFPHVIRIHQWTPGPESPLPDYTQ